MLESLSAPLFGAEIAFDELSSSEFLLFEMEATSVFWLVRRAPKGPDPHDDPFRGRYSTCALSGRLRSRWFKAGYDQVTSCLHNAS